MLYWYLYSMEDHFIPHPARWAEAVIRAIQVGTSYTTEAYSYELLGLREVQINVGLHSLKIPCPLRNPESVPCNRSKLKSKN